MGSSRKPLAGAVAGAFIGVLIAVAMCAEEAVRYVMLTDEFDPFRRLFPASLAERIAWGAVCGFLLGFAFQQMRSARRTRLLSAPVPDGRAYQFSISTLFVLMLLVAIAMGRVAIIVQRVAKERGALDAIWKCGGRFSWGTADLRHTQVTDDDLPCLLDLPRPRPPQRGVETLYLDGTRISDGGLELLRRLDKLKHLSVADTQVTDAGLANLGQLHNLECLNLSGTRVDGSGMRSLVDLPRLETLYLNGTEVSDGRLALLRCLDKLKNLGLADTQVTDAGLAYLGQLHNLERLNLSGTRIDGSGLRYLGELTRLRSLGLMRTNVGDRHLGELPELPELRELFLCDTKVTDSGLLQLKTYPNLESIALERTRATWSGFERLSERMPTIGWRLNAKMDP